MKKKIIIGVLIGLFIISLLLSMYFILIKKTPLFMVCFILCVLFFIVTVTYISYNKSEREIFEANVNSILRLYNDILVKVDNYPDLVDKNVIRLDNFDDLIDAQIEMNKPIYYIKQAQTCSFILIDNKEALVYVLKSNNSVISAIDIIIKDIEFIKKQKSRRNNVSDDLLSDIDRTTIIKMSDTRKFKVSPIKNKKKNNKEDV